MDENEVNVVVDEEPVEAIEAVEEVTKGDTLKANILLTVIAVGLVAVGAAADRLYVKFIDPRVKALWKNLKERAAAKRAAKTETYEVAEEDLESEN